MDNLRLAVVTGANRGLGLETSRQLALKGITVLLTSRDPEGGHAAMTQIWEEGMDLNYHPLDVLFPDSVAALVADRYGGTGGQSVPGGGGGQYSLARDPA